MRGPLLVKYFVLQSYVTSNQKLSEPSMAIRPMLICIHDASPAFAEQTRIMIRDLAPIVGRRISFGVVPDWHGAWPLSAHLDYCRMLSESSEELLLHGYSHRREHGHGLVTWLSGRCDEMNGLDEEQTKRTLDAGQRIFSGAFGEHARGFLAPGWQRGRVDAAIGSGAGLEYMLGFFSLEPFEGRAIPLATYTWDCARWGWPGHIGDRLGRLLHSIDRGVPALAIHPRDVPRGFWPGILRLTQKLADAGYEPVTPSQLLEARC